MASQTIIVETEAGPVTVQVLAPVRTAPLVDASGHDSVKEAAPDGRQMSPVVSAIKREEAEVERAPVPESNQAVQEPGDEAQLVTRFCLCIMPFDGRCCVHVFFSCMVRTTQQTNVRAVELQCVNTVNFQAAESIKQESMMNDQPAEDTETRSEQVVCQRLS